MGRFINADTIAAVTGDLLSTNMFAYTKNNPINMKDDHGFLSSSVLEKVEKVRRNYRIWQNELAILQKK
ncbi:hypothetical protein [Clostridium sp. UBA4548]|uniref:hypothetical protein n=1 Tax=Clostridium sp. UBA4548 TaxID=1946361 RepID=UPI0025B7BE45|nr:hypothetical protein [Clostridium sp. UBA4548]